MGNRRKNGAGTIRERKDGRWEGRIIIGYDDNGKPQTKSVFGKSKSECSRKLKEYKKENCILGGKLITQARSAMTFGEWMDLWYRSYCKNSLRESTQANYENIIYKHVIPMLGHIPLEELTQTDIQQFYTHIKTEGRLQYTKQHGNGLSDRVVRECHIRCKAALDKAVSEGLIEYNPAIGCKVPPKKSKEMQVLTHDEIQRFLIQAKHDGFYEIFLLDLMTGMRRGELIGLQWRDVNFKTREIRIERQVSRIKGELKITKPKTKSSIRTIVVSEAVVNMLKEYQPRTNGSKWLFPSPVKVEDSPRDPHTVYQKMKKILEKADCKVIRFHDLRHTFATLSLEAGNDIKTLSAMIGHVSAATTINIYSHINPEMLNNAANNIDYGIGQKVLGSKHEESSCDQTTQHDSKEYSRITFKPKSGKIRKSGTGGIYQINDNYWEGKYTPTNAEGKREYHHVYARTREECEKKLEEKIKEVRERIQAEKEQLQGMSL